MVACRLDLFVPKPCPRVGVLASCPASLSLAVCRRPLMFPAPWAVVTQLVTRSADLRCRNPYLASRLLSHHPHVPPAARTREPGATNRIAPVRCAWGPRPNQEAVITPSSPQVAATAQMMTKRCQALRRANHRDMRSLWQLSRLKRTSYSPIYRLGGRLTCCDQLPRSC
jgi:hypothetical protein